VGEALVHTTRPEPGVVLVQLRGELDVDSASALRQVLIDQIDRGDLDQLAVDMARLTFMDSTGIGALVSGYGAAQHAGIRFRVRNPSRFVYQQLQITGLAALFGCTEPATP